MVQEDDYGDEWGRGGTASGRRRAAAEDFPQPGRRSPGAELTEQFPQPGRRSARAESADDFPQPGRRSARVDSADDFPQPGRRSARVDSADDFPQPGRRSARFESADDFPQPGRRPMRADSADDFPQPGRRPMRSESVDDFPQPGRRSARVDSADDFPQPGRRSARAESAEDFPQGGRRSARAESVGDFPGMREDSTGPIRGGRARRGDVDDTNPDLLREGRPQVRRQRRSFLAKLQKFGRSLMLPIVTLPVAGLMLRIGQDDILGKDGLQFNEAAAILQSGGNAVFKWLPLIFAVGVASGMAKRADTSTALAAVVGYMVFHEVLQAMSILRMAGVTPENVTQKGMSYGVLGGILVGLITAKLWQRYHKQRLPSYLAFFGGRRLVPILTAFATSALAVAMGFVYRFWDTVLTEVGLWTADNGIVGGFVFGAGNRLLLPVGLHHILNATVWFQVGDCTKNGVPAHGDLTCFLATQGQQGGTFMTGFFPIMMFALPAAALAIIHEARPENRKSVAGLMSSTAIMAFLTGVTEPIEFAFMFVAWPLYIFHSLMTGISIALCNGLGIRSGFSFSAGVMDLGINWGISEKPILLIIIGSVYAVIYYTVFRWAIRRFDLQTPGREPDFDGLGDDEPPATRRLRKARDKAEEIAAKTASARSIRD